MSNYLVHNLHSGYRKPPYPFKSWIDYWTKATGRKPLLCKNIGCASKEFMLATDGAHVQLTNGNNKKWYIVPLCHICNCQFGQELEVEGPLVSITDPSDILW